MCKNNKQIKVHSHWCWCIHSHLSARLKWEVTLARLTCRWGKSRKSGQTPPSAEGWPRWTKWSAGAWGWWRAGGRWQGHRPGWGRGHIRWRSAGRCARRKQRRPRPGAEQRRRRIATLYGVVRLVGLVSGTSKANSISECSQQCRCQFTYREVEDRLSDAFNWTRGPAYISMPRAVLDIYLGLIWIHHRWFERRIPFWCI